MQDLEGKHNLTTEQRIDHLEKLIQKMEQPDAFEEMKVQAPMSSLLERGESAFSFSD